MALKDPRDIILRHAANVRDLYQALIAEGFAPQHAYDLTLVSIRDMIFDYSDEGE